MVRCSYLVGAREPNVLLLRDPRLSPVGLDRDELCGLVYATSSMMAVFFPAAFLSVTVLAVNLLGDGLRDALDPRMAKSL